MTRTEPATAEAVDSRDETATSRGLLAYGAGVVALFAAVGFGMGLGMNFALGFLIEQFVDPGTDPTDVTPVAITLLINLTLPFSLGALVAGASGFATGRAFPDRRWGAPAVASVASAVGFYVMTLLALFLMFSVLSQYGGGGGGGPFSPGDMVPTIGRTGIPVGITGAVAAYVACELY